MRPPGVASPAHCVPVGEALSASDPGAIDVSDSETFTHAWELLFTNPMLVEAREALTSGVLGGGIVLQDTSNQAQLKLTDAFYLVVRAYYDRAARNALHWMIVVGVVPVHFEKVALSDTTTDANVFVPMVPEYSSVTLSVSQPDWGILSNDEEGNQAESVSQAERRKPRFICTPKMTGPAMFGDTLFKNMKSGAHKSEIGQQELLVLEFSSPAPSSTTGALRTSLAACVPLLRDIEKLTMWRDRAEDERSFPTIMIAHAKSQRGGAASDTIPNMDLIASAVTEVNHEDALERVRVEYMEDHPYTATMDKLSDADRNMPNPFETDNLTRNAALEHERKRSRFVFLPRNHAYVTQHMPTIPTDFIMTIREHEARIRRIMGLQTRDDASASLRHTANNSEHIQNIRHMTFVRYKSDINMFLHQTFGIAKQLELTGASEGIPAYTDFKQPYNGVDKLPATCKLSLLSSDCNDAEQRD